MGAKIYSDCRNNACECGGKFTSKESFKYRIGKTPREIFYPVCEKCGSPPPFFRIKAKIADQYKVSNYVFIRHDQTGNRLTDAFDACHLIKQIDIESENGTFDFKNYDSKKAQSKLNFSNIVDEYLKFNTKRLERKEISPKGFSSKKSSCKVLNEFFKETPLNRIDEFKIREFKNSFTDRLRTRDLALGELKSIFKFAKESGLISFIPDFDPIPKAKKRSKIISIEDAKKVISFVKPEIYKVMMSLLVKYPVRPCELRALQWRDIDFKNNRVYFRRHFSGDELLDGRKSIAQVEKLELDFPISKILFKFISSIPEPINKEEFVFNHGTKGFVLEDRLSDAWRSAAKKAKIKDHNMYEIRHARLTELGKLSNGNISKMMKVSGHTNPKTLTERYIRDESNLDEFFE